MTRCRRWNPSTRSTKPGTATRLPARSLLELDLTPHPAVSELLVHRDHVVVRLGVPGVEGLELRLHLGQPQVHRRLQQQTKTMTAMLPHHRGVVLVAEPRPVSIDPDGRVTGQLAGLRGPSDDPVEPLAAQLRRSFVVAHSLGAEDL